MGELYQCGAFLSANEAGDGGEYVSVVCGFGREEKGVADWVRNYAVAVAGFIALFSLTWWWVGGRQ